jgi:hypothetical protein
MQCSHPNCKAQAMRNGSGFCYVHCDLPEIAAARSEARSRGGKAQRKVRAPQTIAEVKVMLSEALARAMAGDKTLNIRSIQRLASSVIKCYELADLHDKLTRIGL